MTSTSTAKRSTRLPLPACFIESVPDMHSGPWTANSTMLRMYAADWAAQPVETHNLRDLHATQDRLLAARLDRQRTPDPAKVPTRGAARYPCVIVWDDQTWIVDGHHRLAVAHENGQATFQAYTLRLTSSPQPADGSRIPTRYIPR